MPIYEFYCPDNHKIYQFYAKTLAQGKIVPKCPDNPKYRMQKSISRFAVNTGAVSTTEAVDGQPLHKPENFAGATGGADDARMEAAMSSMEREFSNVDENDPRAMGRMMRRMAEITGEKIDGEMEEVVRKLEEGTDPEKLEDQLGGGPDEGAEGGDPYGDLYGGGGPPETTAAAEVKEARMRLKALRRTAPARDPKLYDYE